MDALEVIDAIDVLLHSSPAETDQIVIGVVAGVIILATLATTVVLRRLFVAALVIAIVVQVFVNGFGGLAVTADSLLHVAHAHESFVKGLLAGKMLAGFWWRLLSGSGGQRNREIKGVHR